MNKNAKSENTDLVAGKEKRGGWSCLLKWGKVLAKIAVFVTMVAFLPGLVRAGDLEPTDPPGSTIHTLDKIYNKPEQIVAGGLAPVAKTGQTMLYAAEDYGDLQKGDV